MQHQVKSLFGIPFVTGETANQPIPARLPNEIIIFNCFHPIFEFVFSTLNVQTV